MFVSSFIADNCALLDYTCIIFYLKYRKANIVDANCVDVMLFMHPKKKVRLLLLVNGFTLLNSYCNVIKKLTYLILPVSADAVLRQMLENYPQLMTNLMRRGRLSSIVG